MKTHRTLSTVALLALIAFIFSACTPVSLTSWVNPQTNQKVSHVIVWGMFEKIQYEKPFEQSVASYFNGRGVKSIEALSLMTPAKKYEAAELEEIVKKTPADGVLIVTYTGSDKQDNYVPATTTVYPAYYGSYYSYYSYGYPTYYGGGYGVTTGGYWTTTTTLNLRANLYSVATKDLLWTAEIQVTDPQYVDEASYQVASQVFADWQKHGLVGKK
jgi:hypothetical protein